MINASHFQVVFFNQDGLSRTRPSGFLFSRITFSHVLLVWTVDRAVTRLTSCQATATRLSARTKTESSPRFSLSLISTKYQQNNKEISTQFLFLSAAVTRFTIGWMETPGSRWVSWIRRHRTCFPCMTACVPTGKVWSSRQVCSQLYQSVHHVVWCILVTMKARVDQYLDTHPMQQ